MTEPLLRDRLLLPERLAGIDLNLVLAFDALARAESVTAAARSLGVTQSAMSHALRRLRDLLGDPLLVRVGNAMVLTPRAEALVVPLRSGLLSVARALLMPLEFDPSSSQRSFALASPDLFDVLALPPLLARMGYEAPGVELKVSSPGGGRSDQLATGELDVAITARFEGTSEAVDPGGTGLLRRVLFRDRFVCLLRAGHPTLGKTRTRSGAARALSLESYVKLSHVLVSARGNRAGPVDNALAARGLQRRIALSVPHFMSALAIVAQSDLVLTAPAGARLAASGRDLVALRPPLALPEHTVNMVWHERFSHDAGHRWLREQLMLVARELGHELQALELGNTRKPTKPRARAR